MTPLVDKVAIVTGASRGIGRAIAERLSRNGASVVINYTHSADKAQEVVAVIKDKGGYAVAVQADMSQVTEIRRLFQETINHFGHLDILVNNAAIVGTPTLVAEVTEEEFDKIFTLNVKGAFFALQEAAQHMRDGGRIVNISSSLTVYAQEGFGVYAGSKGAIKQFTQIAAKELGKRGITVNSIMPGPTETDAYSSTPSEVQKAAADSSPFGRLGHPCDIADIVAVLVSDEARWLSGQHILANGGATY